MILVVGGMYAGKREWVASHLGYTEADMGSDASSACPVLYDAHNLALSCSAQDLFGREVVICNEVGAGLVPVDAQERALREAAGRLSCDLAAQAVCVVRVVCGIGSFIKGSLDLAYKDMRHLRIELYRHGATPGNSRSAYIGVTDEALSEEGRAFLQARAQKAPKAAGEESGPVYVSSRRRTQQSADILFPGCEQIQIASLDEMDFGVFEGKGFQQLEDDADYRAWVDGGCIAKCPKGEGKEAFCRRVTAAFAALVDEALASGQTLLRAVVHGGTAMAVLERYAVPKKPYFDWHGEPGASWTLSTDERHWACGQCVLVGQTGGQALGRQTQDGWRGQ